MALSRIKSMDIHQLGVNFDERQDRLLLRVNTVDAQEVRLWLTRRISLRLMGPLQTAIARLEASQASVPVTNAQAKAMLVELKHEDFLQKADLKTPYSSEKKTLPLGPEPLVVTEITIHIQGTEGAQMVFQDAGSADTPARSCSLQMQPPLVHGMLHLLRNAMAAAHWHPPGDPGATVTAEALRSDDDIAISPLTKPNYTH